MRSSTTARHVSALSYAVDRDHVQYAGRLAREDVARLVAQGQGISGANPDYVRATQAASRRARHRRCDAGLARPEIFAHGRAIRPPPGSARASGKAPRYPRSQPGVCCGSASEQMDMPLPRPSLIAAAATNAWRAPALAPYPRIEEKQPRAARRRYSPYGDHDRFGKFRQAGIGGLQIDPERPNRCNAGPSARARRENAPQDRRQPNSREDGCSAMRSSLRATPRRCPGHCARANAAAETTMTWRAPRRHGRQVRRAASLSAMLWSSSTRRLSRRTAIRRQFARTKLEHSFRWVKQ